MYRLSALGLIVSSVLLALEHASMGHRLAAAGFALLALGEARVLNPTDVPGPTPPSLPGCFSMPPVC